MDAEKRDGAERSRQQMGEYYLPDDTSAIQQIVAEQKWFERRIQELEDSVAVHRADIQGLWQSHTRIETALIGADGKNGIRGSMQDHYKTTSERLDGLEQSTSAIREDVQRLLTIIKTVIKIVIGVGGVVGFVGVVTEIIQSLPVAVAL